MLNDYYLEHFSCFIERVKRKDDEEYLCLTYNELLKLRSVLLEQIIKYEDEFSLAIDKDSAKDLYEEVHFDPSAIYSINLDRLSLLAEVIKHKHFSLQLLKDIITYRKKEKAGLLSLIDKVFDLIKKDPKVSYIDMFEMDRNFKIAVDLLIDYQVVSRVGKPGNTYWKIVCSPDELKNKIL